ncbi:MAG: hypothetical protein M3444_02855 [Acidobacteriota bacterium]|nr:hypothetical protein [Acidobacteriota bacterium]
MKGLFDRVSRKSWRLRRALVVLAVVMSAALALAWPATGKTAPDCWEPFYVAVSYTPPNPSIDCDTAQHKAFYGALQTIQNTAAGQCLVSCPTAVLDSPLVVNVSDCSQSGTRFNATATAHGTYHCE